MPSRSPHPGPSRARPPLAGPIGLLIGIALAIDARGDDLPKLLPPPTATAADPATLDLPELPPEILAEDAGPVLEAIDDAAPPIPDAAVTPVDGCASCSQGFLFHSHHAAAGPPGGAALFGPPPCPDLGCDATGCVPGRDECYPFGCDWFIARYLNGIYQGICCPDPCYQPKWEPIADAGYFIDAARPVSQQRLRFDSAFKMDVPDRAEYFWARTTDPGKGPRLPEVVRRKPPGVILPEPPEGIGGRRPPPRGWTTLDYYQLNYYVETAAPAASAFVETPYRYVRPAFGPTFSGFSDMSIGTKALLFDTALLQLSFQFKTTLPIGNAGRGLGTGHVSLEPSLLTTFRVAEDTAIQTQLSQWIPIGGDSEYAGAIMHYHLSANQVLCRIRPDCPLLGTIEYNGWIFQDGAYTSPKFGTPRAASESTYGMLGAGLRLVICDKLDFGAAGGWPITETNWGESTYRVEFRYRF